MSPDVTISPSAAALSHFIVLVAQVFDCEYFSGIRFNEIVCPLSVVQQLTTHYQSSHTIKYTDLGEGRGLIRSRLGNN